MAFDFHSLLPDATSGLLYFEEDTTSLFGLPLTLHSLKLTYDRALLYREQINETVVGQPVLRWSTSDSHVELQMSYVYRTYSYYQSYPLDRSALAVTTNLYSKEVNAFDEELNQMVLQTVVESREELQRPISYGGLGVNQRWFKSDYFAYNDTRVTMAIEYPIPKGTPDRRLMALERMLTDIDAVKDTTLILGSEVKQLPAAAEFAKQWADFWATMNHYRELLKDPPPLDTTVVN